MHLDDYAECLMQGRAIRGDDLNLWGRILRGRCLQDFRTLTNDLLRSIVLLMDGESLAELPGKSGYEMLLSVGHEPQDIKTAVSVEKNSFKLVIFSGSIIEDVVLGNWDNMIHLACREYPKVASILEEHREELKRSPFQVPFEWYERQSGYVWNEVIRDPSKDIRFMTEERLLVSAQTVVDARSFLYHTMHLRRLYRGDGWLHDLRKGRLRREWAVKNRPQEEWCDHRIIDIDVCVPL